jgi:hypothetical protein
LAGWSRCASERQVRGWRLGGVPSSPGHGSCRSRGPDARGHWRQRQPASMFSLSRSVTCPRVETPAPAGREPGTRMFLDHADPKLVEHTLQSCRRRDHAKIHFSEVGFTSQIFHRASLGKPFLLWIEGDRLIEGKTSSPSSLQSTNTN